MRVRRRLEQALTRLGRVRPAPLAGRAEGPAATGDAGRTDPTVSVVVAVGADAAPDRLAACLQSLRDQAHRALDVRVVPPASSGDLADQLLEVARAHAAADPRLRVERAAPDRPAAWNAGAAAAAAPYLLLLRGEEELPPAALSRLVGALEESGSDLAVGRLVAPDGPQPGTEAAFAPAHEVHRRRTTLAEAPVALADLALGNRLLRRTFWERVGLACGPDDPAGAALAATALVAADAVDLLAEETCRQHGRNRPLTFGARPDLFGGLDGWLREHGAARRAVAGVPVPEARTWWAATVLSSAVVSLLDDVERAGEEQWHRLRQAVERLLELGGEEVWARLPADARVRVWLARAGRRPELEEYALARALERGLAPTEVSRGAVVAHLPFRGDARVGVPDAMYVMREEDTPLFAELHGIRWVAPDRVELRCFVRVEHVDLPEPPTVVAALVPDGPGGHERVPLRVRLEVDARANLVEGSRHQDYARGAAVVEVDAARLADLAAEAGRPLRWSVELDVTAQGVRRRGGFTKVDDRGSAGMVGTGHLGDRRVGAARVGLRGRRPRAFRVRAEPWSGPELVDVDVDGRTVTAVVDPGGVPVVAARLDERGGSGRLPADLGPEPGSEPGSEHRRLRLTAQLAGAAPDETDATPRRWSLVLADADGGEHAVGWPPEAPQWLGAGGGDVVLSRSETGDVDVVDAVGTLVVDELTHAPDEIVLRGRWLGRAPRHLALRLEGRRTRLDADVDEVGGVLQARLPTHHDEWGLGATAVGPGRYWLRLLHGATPEQQVPGRVLVGEELLDRLVAPTVDAVHRFRPARRGREAGLVLQPPVADEDLAPRGQARLQEWYRRCELPVDPDLVYLQSYAGASATDSPLAIHEVLRRRHPHLRICWGVADLSSAVPEGGVPVVMHSPEWYRVLATAAHLCLNVEPDRWFEPRPGQQLMFTSHGYPGKSMGIREWVSKGHSPRRIEQELARTSGRWSLLLTPAPEMDEHYRREYRYDGPIHHDGYPRDDLLLSPDAGRVRDETRARLGIAPEQTVVLYAPTWRDDAATHWRRAELVTHLDLDAASRELGPDHVFLMRGHRFHSAADHAGGSQVLDVTAYPEVNHLVLAADVAVLDYSSLRFDFALTGRPMVFLVPDLAAYAGTVRGFLYPFEDSAPGPLLDTGEQVVEQLRDLDGLRQRYGAAIEEFNRRYNHRQTGGSAESVVAAFFG